MNSKISLVALCASIASISMGAVVINEFAYDDSGTDSLEFVELYNNGASPVDISGWTIEGIDLAPTADSVATIPGAIGSNTTVLAAGAYYVVGMTAVPLLNLDITANTDFQNDMEALTLKNGATIVDSLVQERNKANIVIPVGLGEPAFNGTTATSGGGIWANFALIEAGGADLGGIATSGNNASFTIARHTDGVDTNNNELDFGTQIASPGRANNFYGAVTLPYTNNFDAADNTKVSAFAGAYVNGTIQDPTAADVVGTVEGLNPSVIVASPQGGNALVCWDSSGGGNNYILNLTAPLKDLVAEFYLYVPAALTGTDVEEMTAIVVRGSIDKTSYNTGTSNGDVGIRVRMANSVAGPQIFLEERKNGVSTQIGSTVTGVSGWQRIFLRVNGTDVLGIVGGTYGSTADGTQLVGATTINQAGGVGFGYREAVALNTNCRPLTMDAFTIRAIAADVRGWELY